MSSHSPNDTGTDSSVPEPQSRTTEQIPAADLEHLCSEARDHVEDPVTEPEQRLEALRAAALSRKIDHAQTPRRGRGRR